MHSIDRLLGLVLAALFMTSPALSQVTKHPEWFAFASSQSGGHAGRLERLSLDTRHPGYLEGRYGAWRHSFCSRSAALEVSHRMRTSVVRALEDWRPGLSLELHRRDNRSLRRSKWSLGRSW